MNYNICRVSKEDLSFILKLQRDAFYKIAEAENNFNIKPMIQTYEELVEEFERTLILKCVIDEKIVGSVRATVDENNQCHIGRLVVHPDYRRKGIGNELMNAIEKEFRNSSCFCLFTSKSSAPTVKFYAQLGYVIVGELNDEKPVMFLMEKKNKNY